jgi:hypothetical protein
MPIIASHCDCEIPAESVLVCVVPGIGLDDGTDQSKPLVVVVVVEPACCHVVMCQRL